MKWIVSDFFARSPVMAGPTLALLIFVVVFTITAMRAFRAADRGRQERLANLPLEQDERHV